MFKKLFEIWATKPRGKYVLKLFDDENVLAILTAEEITKCLQLNDVMCEKKDIDAKATEWMEIIKFVFEKHDLIVDPFRENIVKKTKGSE